MLLNKTETLEGNSEIFIKSLNFITFTDHNPSTSYNFVVLKETLKTCILLLKLFYVVVFQSKLLKV